MDNSTSDQERIKRIANPKGRQVRPEAFAEISVLISDADRSAEFLIERLHLIQDKFGRLSEEHLAALAQLMKLPQSHVFEVASFYHHFDIVMNDDLEGDASESSHTVRVCDSITCQLAGAEELLEKMIFNYGDAIRIVRVPCVGNCANAPVAVLGKRQFTDNVVKNIGVAAEKNLVAPDLPTYENLASYEKNGGYQFLRGCIIGEKSREKILAEIDKSGLRGMGGGGFPVARKWQFLETAPKPRVLVMNADEGEPGTFKDRYLFETTPHRILEGMLLAAWFVEAEDIYIYLRDEYPHIHALLTEEIDKISDAGLSKGVTIHLRRGAGSYVCGEESALLESIEGKRGLPRNRPPFPAQAGLFGRPTLINNVETLYWVREILVNSAEWYVEEGRPRYYSVSGRVAEPGVICAPSSTTVRQLINDHCGGMMNSHTFKAYLPGGASGGILPAELDNLPLDFGTLGEHGCFVGSAAVVIFSDQDKIREIVLNLLRFFEEESCGQCTPCRLGCTKLIELVESKTQSDDIIQDLSQVMRDASICGLGQAAPNPVLSAMKFFADEL